MSENRQILEQALACFGDPSRRSSYLDLYAHSIILHGYAGVEPGIDSVRRFYEMMWQAFPDSRVVVHDVIEQADRLACRFTLAGTHQGDFQGIPATGRAIALDGITILRFAQGKCVERWSQADFPGLMAQIS